MRRFKYLIVSIFVLIYNANIHAHDFYQYIDGNTFYFNIISNTDKTVELTRKQTGTNSWQVALYSGDLELPSTVSYNGVKYTVTRLERALDACSNLRSIKIPETITEFANGAFNGCSSLPVKNNIRYADWIAIAPIDRTCSTYEIDKDAKAIMSDCFSSCTNLKEIIIPNKMQRIYSNAFWNCKALENIILPEGLSYIGDKAFYGCSSLSSLELPKSLIHLGDYVFYNCTSLTSLELSNSITNIGKYAFANCSSLKIINVPESLESIEGYIFQNCSSIRHISIPNGLTSIRSHAFDGCTNLFSIKIPNSVSTIESYAFYNCSSLEHLQLPNEIENINELFWSGGSRFVSIYIPKSVKSIDYNAFYGTSLKQIVYEGTEEEWNIINGFRTINGLVVLYNQKPIDATYFSYNNVDYAINDREKPILEVVGCQKSDEIIISYSIYDNDKEYIVSSIKDDFFMKNAFVSCVKYEGGKYQWDKINLGNNVDYLSNVNIIYYYDECADNLSEVANCIYVDNSNSLIAGSSNCVSIRMKNYCPIAGFQFEMELPKHISLNLDENNAVQLTGGRTTPQKHNILEVSRLNNGHYLIVCSSTSNNAFSDNDGDVLSLKLKIDNSIEEGDHLIAIHNTAMATPNAEVFRTTKLLFPIDVSSVIPGDANGDGRISVADLTAIASYLLGNTPTGFIEAAADATGDGRISVADLTSIADNLMNNN